jgi:maleate isomerase
MVGVSATDFEPIRPRARLGFIIPSSNRMAEPQFQLYAPDGVVPHFARLRMTGRHAAPLEALMPRITQAAETLADAKCDAIVLQCTGTSMSGGVESEQGIIRAMEAATGRPALTAASSLMAAFEALDANRLVFVSETTRPGHEAKLAYLAEAGLDIIADRAACLEDSDEYCITPPQFWFEFVRAMRNDRADAYFISCANIHSIDVIAALEAELGRPVVTSNQAALWCALRTAGIADAIPGLGRLLQMDLARIPAQETAS